MKKRRFTLVVLVIVVSLCAGGLLSASPVLAGGDVNEGVCPNEGYTGFSADLPDCRAYEQVSPVFKNGFNLTFDYILDGGERVQGESVGLFAGATATTHCAVNEYDLARGEAGWVATALKNVPLAQFDYASKECMTSLLNDEGSSLLQLRPSSGSVYVRDLYLHRPGGSFELVGPMLPQSDILPSPTGPGEAGGFQPGSDFVDATPSFSDVLFTLEAQSKYLVPGLGSELWPGDTTQSSPEAEYVPSLYEYAGVNNTTPTLVGVDNSGHLISDCGIAPGGWEQSGDGNHLNVISEGGSRVFFTAVGTGKPALLRCSGAAVVPPVDELFARINSGQPQSPVDAQGHCTAVADACTVAISEPGAGAGCTGACVANATAEADFRAANYEKASRDGSKVFFTSTQQLLNDATQDSESEDSAVPYAGEKGCDITPRLSTGTTGPNGCNLYEYDLEENPETKAPFGLSLVSGGDTSGLGPEVQGVAAISEDGSHVYFVAKGVLAVQPRAVESGGCIAELDQAELALEEATKEGKCRPKRDGNNLYVYDTTTRETKFIATLAESDGGQWTFNAAGLGGNGDPMNVTDDGGFLVFTSTEHLTMGDTSTVRQVFRYQAATGALVRISLGNEGHDGLGASSIAFRRSASPPIPESLDSDSHPAISENGITVVFSSSEALVPGAPTSNECATKENGKCSEYVNNVYEYDEGRVHLIAGGATEGPPVISQSGRDIMFSTHEQLVSQDGDMLPDIYDARVDGGFASAGRGAQCSGGGCQEASGGQSEMLTAPGSATFSGPGDVAPPTPAITTKPKPKAKPLTRAQKLAKALHTCRQKRKQARISCESAARRKYGPKAKKAGHNGRTSR